ncbi:VWA domain-containing protein [Aquabacterium sp. OR-4]|uniref:VWA domain-containing protein n=1 Tax=Aquabacterium sp. OR-4 TaxID=2978127 RepID=UPI0021B4803D|nr:VWA domain-containing protein [Aquabacterium sp. OR-4]MDT7837875.1 VWA domain-containing protein [Aquabacterium sp. OR-4]
MNPAQRAAVAEALAAADGPATPGPPAADCEAPFDRLAALPRTLWLPTLTTSAGHSAQRLADVATWRTALLAGTMPPPEAHFGDAAAAAPLRQAVGELGLAALARGAEPLAEQVLRTLLWHLDRIADLQPRLSRAEAIARVAQDFHAAWTLERAGWEELLTLLQGLGDLARLRWDQMTGLLARREWQEALRIAETLQQLPELAALIRRLGRAERAPLPQPPPPSPPPTPSERARRLLGLRVVHTTLPDAPGELRGIRHTGRIAQMLPAEAAMLRHPVLRKLWHARFAEARLLGYDSQAQLHDLRPDPTQRPRADRAPPQPEPLQRGPIILCLDTSGSMHGAPEAIAKAVALQALRTAYAERRACVVIAFGGPGELLERELAHTPAGLAALMDLMGQGFDGGTDVQAPIERAIARVHQAAWASADLLIVSDGEFGCTPATLARLDEARAALGLRVQGVLVGDRETLGLMEVADDIFWVRDWRRHGPADATRGGGTAFSPVHSKSLTALYFPNALSARAARHRPG